MRVALPILAALVLIVGVMPASAGAVFRTNLDASITFTAGAGNGEALPPDMSSPDDEGPPPMTSPDDDTGPAPLLLSFANIPGWSIQIPDWTFPPALLLAIIQDEATGILSVDFMSALPNVDGNHLILRVPLDGASVPVLVTSYPNNEPFTGTAGEWLDLTGVPVPLSPAVLLSMGSYPSAFDGRTAQADQMIWALE